MAKAAAINQGRRQREEMACNEGAKKMHQRWLSASAMSETQ